MCINLLPWRETQQTKNLILLYSLTFLFVLIITVGSIVTMVQIKHKIISNNVRHDYLIAQIASTPKHQSLKKLRKEYKQLRTTIKFINQRSLAQQNLLASLKNIGGLMPATMRSTNIRYKNNELNISGIALRTKEIGIFLKRLKRFKFIKSVRLGDMNSGREIKNAVMKFKLIVRFKGVE